MILSAPRVKRKSGRLLDLSWSGFIVEYFRILKCFSVLASFCSEILFISAADGRPIAELYVILEKNNPDYFRSR
jgi:hypothetical protein